MEENSQQITQLLNQWSEGDAEVLDDLMPLVYKELRRQAAGYLRRERADHTLQPTALINEAYLKLIDQRDVKWQNRAHFFAIAAQAMRRILVDYARERKREKRGGAAAHKGITTNVSYNPPPIVTPSAITKSHRKICAIENCLDICFSRNL